MNCRSQCSCTRTVFSNARSERRRSAPEAGRNSTSISSVKSSASARVGATHIATASPTNAPCHAPADAIRRACNQAPSSARPSAAALLEVQPDEHATFAAIQQAWQCAGYDREQSGCAERPLRSDLAGPCPKRSCLAPAGNLKSSLRRTRALLCLVLRLPSCLSHL